MEQLGLIRMVMAGHLQELTERMLHKAGTAAAEEVEQAAREADEMKAKETRQASARRRWIMRSDPMRTWRRL